MNHLIGNYFHPRKIAVLILLGLILLTACKTALEPAPDPLPTQIVLEPTSTPSAIPSRTPVVSPTLWPTITPIVVVGIIIADKDEIKQYLDTFPSLEQDCSLPCWWGVEPGKTTVTQMKKNFHVLSLELQHDEREDQLNKYSLEFLPLEQGNLLFTTRITYFDDYDPDEAIDWVAVSSNRVEEDRNIFLDLWEKFSPENIVQSFGTPSEIRIETYSTVWESAGIENISYKLFFIYQESGFLIVYGGSITYETDYKICPNFSDSGNLGESIEIYTAPSNSSYSLQDLKAYLNDNLFGAYSDANKSLESVSSFTIEEFTNTYSNDPVFCFDTPRDIWPEQKESDLHH